MRGFLLFIILSTVFQYESMTGPFENKELFDMAQVVQDENLIIDEWEVIYRDQIDRDKANSIIQFLNNQQNSEMVIKDNHQHYTYKEKTISPTIEVTYHLIVPNNINNPARLTVTMNGIGWNNAEQIDIIRQATSNFNRFLTQSSSKFTCLLARDSAIIENGISMRKISEKFNLLHSFTQSDKRAETQYVEELYGYNPQWENEITTEDNPINVQMVLKQDENKGNLITIGTPIILNEY